MSKIKVYFVDDEKNIRHTVYRLLRNIKIDVECIESAKEVLSLIKLNTAGILVTDLKMPGMDGFELFKKVHEIDPHIPVIIVSGHGDIETAVQLMRDGAYDYIEKPFESSDFLRTVRRAIDQRVLYLDNLNLRSEILANAPENEVLKGDSAAIRQLREQITNIAETDANVVITGETGTGKELVARCLHNQSSRVKNRLVAVNCGAIPETMFDSELFGHETGAFTGAVKQRIGKIEYANGGTLFLDEVNSMPLAQQVKLLRVLQEKKIERLGSNESISIDIRIIAATQSDLKKCSDAGEFREDLYYRLNVIPLTIAPLRERKDDITMLFKDFLKEACARYQRPVPEVSTTIIARLMSMNWPGNVRELQNLAERVSLAGFSCLAVEGNNSLAMEDFNSPDKSLSEIVGIFEKKVIEDKLTQADGNVDQASKALKLPRKTLYDKMKKYSIDPSLFRAQP